jgi:hypothetical protein
MAAGNTVAVTKSDLTAAWAILENLAVSFDQIGSVCGSEDRANGAGTRRALQEALVSYLTPELVRAINDARVQLGRYIPDEEAEDLVERIPYWSYASAPKVPSQQP